ncbi:restriction endonuclease subunit S [Pedobacter nyackensis]|uniref:Type I restriction enzyme, S subunit n=1 Tax=Pedobacter nyackensis TaxID=475255 RepID=A0A1W2DVY5_9SPHI|nr:restriction endonuclease subunit S [Pedobacter nyackensis]SMD01186.1 type I restriction enzyme, S subunit [Pedobacter nyackensis]
MSEWKEYKLGDITNWYSGGTPSKDKKDYWGGSIPWISAKTMTDYQVSSSELTITENGLANGSRLAIEKDILLLVRGSGLFIDIPINIVEKPVAFNQDIKAIRAKNPELQDFIFFWLQGNKKGLNDILEETGIGAGKFDTDLLKKLDISIPTNKTEFDFIVQTAKAIFDKIDLLERQNAALEKMAQTLFRQWFLEEANDEWAISSLSEMANFLNGLACQKFPPKNDLDKLPALKIKELSSGISENSDWVSTDIKPEYIVKNSDVIFAWSASLMVKIWDGQDCILNQHLFKVTSEDYPKWFYYLWCKHHLTEFISIAASHATTMGHIKRGDLDEAKVLIPSPEELGAMTEQAEPLIQKIIANNIQINTLIKLRDSLLPKLMTGEVTVEQ